MANWKEGEELETKQSILLDAMKAEHSFVSKIDGYDVMYRKIIDDIKLDFGYKY